MSLFVYGANNLDLLISLRREGERDADQKESFFSCSNSSSKEMSENSSSGLSNSELDLSLSSMEALISRTYSIRKSIQGFEPMTKVEQKINQKNSRKVPIMLIESNTGDNTDKTLLVYQTATRISKINPESDTSSNRF